MKEPLEQYKPAERLDLPKSKEELPVVFEKVMCPSCNGHVHADNLNLEKSLAKCGDCSVIFSFEKDVEKVKLVEKVKMKQEHLRPEGIDLFYFNDELNISMQQPMHMIDVLGCLLYTSPSPRDRG